MYRAAVLLLALLLAGCATRTLVATAGPSDSTIYVDGRAAGYQGYAEVVQTYYGKVLVSARVNPRPERDHDYLEERLLVDVPPPFSRWLFLVDFFLEAISYPFHDPYRQEVNIALQPRAVLVPGVTDPDAGALRLRAQGARLRR
ncbi:MAG: hypothetical protein ACYTKC_07640 [Planctomycetota bacterium]|jgi:hypothetical protein